MFGFSCSIPAAARCRVKPVIPGRGSKIDGYSTHCMSFLEDGSVFKKQGISGFNASTACPYSDFLMPHAVVSLPVCSGMPIYLSAASSGTAGASCIFICIRSLCQCAVKAGLLIGMTGRSFLINQQNESVLVAIHENPFDGLHMAGSFPFFP